LLVKLEEVLLLRVSGMPFPKSQIAVRRPELKEEELV